MAIHSIYRFPKSLVISSDHVVNEILSDIPLISVGLAGLVVFIFFFAMRKVNLAMMHLYSAILLAFVASILDIGLVLLLHTGNQFSNDVPGSRPLSIARDVGFSLSIGFRFLFLWVLVAQRPMNESGSTENHSGAWKRWGIIGMLLKWILVGLTVSITTLNILWRVVPTFNVYGPIYLTEAILEIVTTAFFILKLILNISLSLINPRRKIIQYYLVPVFAMIIGICINIGNIVIFAFSESAPGRFLQAVELFIFVAFVLVSTFYYASKSSYSLSRGISYKNFRGLPEVNRYSTFRLFSPDTPSKEEHDKMISTTQNDVEKFGQSTISSPNAVDYDYIRSSTALGAETTAYVGKAPVLYSSNGSASINPFATGQSSFFETESFYKRTSSLYSDITTNDRASKRGSMPSNPPLFGLDAIIHNLKGDTSQRRNTVSSLEDLLRQQNELDRSIEALRLFSRVSTVSSQEAKIEPGTPLVDPNTAISSNGPSTSLRSDFSLSVFPTPPWSLTPSFPSAPLLMARQAEVLGVPIAKPQPHSVPSSLRGSEDSTLQGERQELSIGRRYDVTSFIGSSIPTSSEANRDSSPSSSVRDTASTLEGSTTQPATKTISRVTALPSKPRMTLQVNRARRPLGLPSGPRLGPPLDGRNQLQERPRPPPLNLSQ